MHEALVAIWTLPSLIRSLHLPKSGTPTPRPAFFIAHDILHLGFYHSHLYSQQGLFKRCRIICDLSVWKLVSGPDRIFEAELPGRESGFFSKKVYVALCAKQL
jgi:hypothetical protein